MLKLDKQISGTIYRHILAANKAQHLKGAGCDVGGGGVQYTCLVGCRLPPLDGYAAACLVLTIDVYGSYKCLVVKVRKGTLFVSLRYRHWFYK